ncbi:MAG: DUF4255 domain-containing protein [Methanosarcinales archaeon]|nr:MAG: DUF4255 domain-containing protein [Methanosarcinales archaeon]
MISHIDETLEELLRKKVPLSSEHYDISFDIPTKDWASKISASKPTINLYLYDIKENRELRTNEWQVKQNLNGTADQKKPPVRIDLSYIITAWSPADPSPATTPAIDEHHLLSMILKTLFEYPFIPSDVFLGDLATIDPLPEIPAIVTQPDGFKDQGQGQFWNAVDQFWKPSIQYVVTMPLDLQKKITDTMVTMVTTIRTIWISGHGSPKTIIRLGGIVTNDADPPAPIIGAEVTLVDLNRAPVGKTFSDSEGKFTSERLSEGEYTIKVSAPGYIGIEKELGDITLVKTEDLIIRLKST